jgi:hypothetical protein
MSFHHKNWPSEGAIRRSQILTGAGPGALVDLVDHAVIIKGLDRWSYAKDDNDFIPERRLEAQALAALRATGRWPHAGVALRRPPRCEDDDSHPSRGIHAREFPTWFQCQGCHALIKRDALDANHRHLCTDAAKKPVPAVPIRFVSACSYGHIQEIHWRGFVHHYVREEGMPEPTPGPSPDGAAKFYCTENAELGELFTEEGHRRNGDLHMQMTGTSGELADQVVVCRRCGKRRGLQDLLQPNALGNCSAWRPWLDTNDATCQDPSPPKLLVRTGTNAWYPQMISVLSIEQPESRLDQAVEKHWKSLKKVTSEANLIALLELLEDLAAELEEWSATEVLAAIEARRNDDRAELRPIREAEWRVLMDSVPGLSHDLPPKNERWWARRLVGVDLPPFLDRVVLVHTLREVRALIGFTRLEGSNIDAEGAIQIDKNRTAPLAESANWIPAVEILGEGIFLAFDEKALRQWEATKAVREIEDRFRTALAMENEQHASASSTETFTSARLIMLHSLAHMLITAISLECGYSATAIRERIYCHAPPITPNMSPSEREDALAQSRAGILLYTGTPGSEGTLGGLVEVGRDIVRHLRRAVHLNELCSNDPVCAAHRPDGPEEGRRREGAACHGCLLIAEPSCERRNRELDRTLVVPTVENGDAAFLREWVRTLGG